MTHTTIPRFDSLSDDAFIRASHLVRHPKHPERPVPLQFSPATLWRYVKARNFPQSVKLSTGVTAWRVGDVREWINARIADALALPA